MITPCCLYMHKSNTKNPFGASSRVSLRRTPGPDWRISIQISCMPCKVKPVYHLPRARVEDPEEVGLNLCCICFLKILDVKKSLVLILVEKYLN